MTIERRSLYGFPPSAPAPSSQTVRILPLTMGIENTLPWPAAQPGSAQTVENFYPLDGKLVPRSRLSSLNTLLSIGTMRSMTPEYRSDLNAVSLWVSGDTLISGSTRGAHGIMNSSGSISVASFTSAFGLGIGNWKSANAGFEYALAYDGPTDQNMLVAANRQSDDTITVAYYTNTHGSGKLLMSYLTSAPIAHSVCAFDSYLVAWSTRDGGVDQPTRARWCVRGSPSDWTNPGSGFEDLLDMRGEGNKVVAFPDGRIILFSTLQTYYGVTAAYPAQFIFQPLDPGVGLLAPAMATFVEGGLAFFGSDAALRLLPFGGGASRILSESLSIALRKTLKLQPGQAGSYGWMEYDAPRRLLHIFIDISFGDALVGVVYNMVTGEWAWQRYNVEATAPVCGTRFMAPSTSAISSGFFLASSIGSCYAMNSNLTLENGSPVTGTWRSMPVGTELPGSYKVLQNISVDYVATSNATLTVTASTDAVDRSLSLASSYYGNRASLDLYTGGALPTIQITSTSTGMELHRVDATYLVNGRVAQ